MTERETRAQELRRLITEYSTGEGSEKAEAWNLLADFTYEHHVSICAGLRRIDGEYPRSTSIQPKED